MSLGVRLKELRIDADKTQKEIADIIGCSSKQIIRYEADEQEPTASRLKQLCQLYEVSSDYILGLPKGLKWPR